MDPLADVITRWWPLTVAGVGLAVAAAAAAAARTRTRADDDRGQDAGIDPDARIALSEAEHERDVSIARATQAEERERLALERLASLAPLERRVEIAERRALDAERRLDEIDERTADRSVGSGVADVLGREEGVRRGSDLTDPSSGRVAQLRARLARSAARKRPKRKR
jgi:hypothetical protein